MTVRITAAGLRRLVGGTGEGAFMTGLDTGASSAAADADSLTLVAAL